MQDDAWAELGRLPPSVALMRLAMQAGTEAELRGLLAGDSPALAPLRALLDDNPDAYARMRSVLAAVPHDAPRGSSADTVAGFATAFDRAAALSPEASVALYSLGSASLLAAATDEIVAWLDGHGLLQPGCHVLDVGCGIGRMETALAHRVGTILGLDVSDGMVREASRRCAGLGTVTIRRSSGLDLAAAAGHSVDLVLMVDSMPYVVAAGQAVVATHCAEVRRVLVPGGSLVVLNIGYGGETERDRVLALAEAAGLRVVEAGTRPFRTWDGEAFRFLSPA